MKIALDTNVLVAGLLSPHSPCAHIMRMGINGRFAVCLDGRIYAEYHEVLHRSKFRPDRELIKVVLDALLERAEWHVCPPCGRRLPDADDLPFLEVALHARADYLVTGNLRHFPARNCEPVTVITPADFVRPGL